MTENKIKIETKEVAVINNITSITIQVVNIILNTSALLIVVLYDDNDKCISAVNLELTGDDYSNWGNDDTYLLTYVCNKLQIVPKPEEPPVVDIPQELQ